MRRGVIWAFLAGLSALAVMAYHGNYLLFAIYLVALANMVAVHWWFACSRCSNLCCAVNTRSPEFLVRRRPTRNVGQRAQEFSNVKSLVVGIPLAVTIAVGVVAAWMFNPVGVVIWAVFMVGVATQYSKVTCTGCGNDCPANRNAAYLAWKLENGKGPTSSR